MRGTHFLFFLKNPKPLEMEVLALTLSPKVCLDMNQGMYLGKSQPTFLVPTISIETSLDMVFFLFSFPNFFGFKSLAFFLKFKISLKMKFQYLPKRNFCHSAKKISPCENEMNLNSYINET